MLRHGSPSVQFKVSEHICAILAAIGAHPCNLAFKRVYLSLFVCVCVCVTNSQKVLELRAHTVPCLMSYTDHTGLLSLQVCRV